MFKCSRRIAIPEARPDTWSDPGVRPATPRPKLLSSAAVSWTRGCLSQRFESRKTAERLFASCGNGVGPGNLRKTENQVLRMSAPTFSSHTDEIIRWRSLRVTNDKGRGIRDGVYPMLRDETCFFLAADFDKATWQQDAAHSWKHVTKNVPAALERSVGQRRARLVLFS